MNGQCVLEIDIVVLGFKKYKSKPINHLDIAEPRTTYYYCFFILC